MTTEMQRTQENHPKEREVFSRLTTKKVWIDRDDSPHFPHLPSKDSLEKEGSDLRTVAIALAETSRVALIEKVRDIRKRSNRYAALDCIMEASIEEHKCIPAHA